MAVLIDPPRWPAHGTRWSHLVSDTSLAELHGLARRCDLPARSFDLDHYDVPAERYDDLVAAGAHPVSAHELIRRLRASGLRVPAVQRPLHTELTHRWRELLPGHPEVGEELLTLSGAGNGYVDGVDLSVRAGEIVGLAGLQGSGRTELVESIFGVHPFTRGTMTLRGRAVRTTSPRQAIRQGLALVTEDRKAKGLALNQSILDNATVPYVIDGDGNCHVYVDAAADLNMAMAIVRDATPARSKSSTRRRYRSSNTWRGSTRLGKSTWPSGNIASL